MEERYGGQVPKGIGWFSISYYGLEFATIGTCHRLASLTSPERMVSRMLGSEWERCSDRKCSSPSCALEHPLSPSNYSSQTIVNGVIMLPGAVVVLYQHQISRSFSSCSFSLFIIFFLPLFYFSLLFSSYFCLFSLSPFSFFLFISALSLCLSFLSLFFFPTSSFSQ